MNTWARSGIKDLLVETYDRHGWAIPVPVIDYQTTVLTEFVNKPDWQPRPSYAEQYMTMRTTGQAQALGNVCWFTRAVFPELGTRRGINSSYYVQLGQGCYERVLSQTELPAVKVLCEHFEFLAECAYTAIRLNGEFRSMWD